MISGNSIMINNQNRGSNKIGSRRKILPFAFLLLGGMLLFAARRFFSARNYLDQNGPVYAGDFAMEEPDPVENLTVVSYNIWYGQNIDQALVEIKNFTAQRPLDILFLQEMDEMGVERMARELQMNYVYYPAAIEPKYRRNFGNAVLTRWPVVDSRKLILPHISLSDRMKRIATQAKIRIHDMDVIVYSIHTEPVFILPRYKENQCFAVLDEIGSNAKHVLVGGDFNSFTKAYVDKLEKRYREAGFARATRGSGYTFMRFGIKMSTDQIFSKGFIVKAAGALADAKASDHLPVWTTLLPKKE